MIYSTTVKGWREVALNKKYYFKSRWEINYAYYLEWLRRGGEIKNWWYEEDVFWFLKIKRGVRSFTPDFKIEENNRKIKYVEIKGYMDQRSKTKMRRMAKYYPLVNITLVTGREYKELEKFGRLLNFE